METQLEHKENLCKVVDTLGEARDLIGKLGYIRFAKSITKIKVDVMKVIKTLEEHYSES